MVEHDFICSDSFESSGIVEWNSPSNIALVKYWGKKQNQIPQNPSISFTLSKCYTNTVVEFKPKINTQNEIHFTFDGKENQDFEKKVNTFIKSIDKYFGFLKNHDLYINSKNNFPHSSGIASSASSMSALASCLVDIESQITNNDNSFNLKKKSFISRLGSGSASRSIEGPVTLWGETDAFKERLPVAVLGSKTKSSMSNLLCSVTSTLVSSMKRIPTLPLPVLIVSFENISNSFSSCISISPSSLSTTPLPLSLSTLPMLPQVNEVAQNNINIIHLVCLRNVDIMVITTCCQSYHIIIDTTLCDIYICYRACMGMN